VGSTLLNLPPGTDAFIALPIPAGRPGRKAAFGGNAMPVARWRGGAETATHLPTRTFDRIIANSRPDPVTPHRGGDLPHRPTSAERTPGPASFAGTDWQALGRSWLRPTETEDRGPEAAGRKPHFKLHTSNLALPRHVIASPARQSKIINPEACSGREAGVGFDRSQGF
jgi:hypothetical protein